MMTTDKRTFLLVPAALAGTLLLTSCGGTAGESAQPTPEASEQAASEQGAQFNDSDVAFAQQMIPHHEQAVKMAKLAEGRAGEGVTELAEKIEAAQGPEIEQLNGLLESWGKEPMGDMDSMGDMEHDGMDGMDGMMSQEQMAELKEAEGDAFDTMFLEMMIDHHQGAVDMAEQELDKGANPEAKELAQDIVDAQKTEIEQMTGMLGGDSSTG